ncbi:MAG: S41 family peptidase [Paraprevotella sp.]|nr:S41 family peptidase [Paraprevotella sp.]
MKKIILLLFVLPALLLYTGCIREESDTDDTPLNNFESLWRIIDTQYCFHDYKTQEGCLPWNDVYAKYRPRIDDKMTTAQLFEVLCDMLSELRDGHVNLYSAADVGRYWSWHEDYPSNFNDSIHRLYLGTDYKIAAGIYYKILDDNIGYIYYESFNSSIGDGNLDEVMYYLRLCNGLIVDVRNNSGGTLTYAERLAERGTNEKILLGYIAHKTGTGHNDFSAPETEYLEPSHGVRWQKKAVVLTNRSCYSATNTFIRDMKECPLVTIMGDRTGGGSGMPFSSELPNGWAVRFSACPMYDAEMNQIEFGIEPDISVSLTQEDILRNKDTMIEAARDFLKR